MEINHNTLQLKKIAILSKNAEATVFQGLYLGFPVIIKKRVPKPYRHPQLDLELRNSRLSTEAKILYTARNLGVSVPYVFFVDYRTSSLIMEFLKGCQLKTFIERKQFSNSYLKLLGKEIAKLHDGNLIHGDLTTSNVIVNENSPFQSITIIDFGLGQFSTSIEDKAVDINVFYKTLQSTHPLVWEEAWQSFLEGYMHVKNFNNIIKRFKKIEERTRYH